MKKHYIIYIVCFFVQVFAHVTHAQVQNNGNLFIADNANMYVASGNFYFGSPATTATSRTAIYGKLLFAAGTTWSGASDAHYIDGYAQSIGSNPFTFPTGQSGTYAPVKITPAVTGSIDAAYYRGNPNVIGIATDAAITSLSTIEFWDIRGIAGAGVSVSWRASSNISTLTSGNLADLSIAGWNGSSWIIIPSTVDTTSLMGAASSLTEGSISSDANVDLTTYTYFTLAAKTSSCEPLIVSSGVTKTWNGAWSPSAPTLDDPVVINAPYSGDLACNSLVLNADITLTNGQLVEIINGASGTGKIIMASEASVVQRNPASAGPNIQMTKVTNEMRRYDYVFLSSPITNMTTYFADLLNKDKVAVNGNFGSQPVSAFEQLRTYDAAGLAAINATVANSPVGRGFSATVRSYPPYSTSTTQGAWYDQKFPIHIKTSGVANNGNVPVTVPSNGWARVGNPYPSAIDGEKLLDAVGPNVRKTLYFWTFNSPRAIIANPGNYNNADFATWNYSGGTAACPTCQEPTGKIASMQSVQMKAANATPTTFNITNCMRETTGNDDFFRSASSDRFWVNLTGSNDSFSQMLLSYSGNATLGYDDGYDSPKMGGVLTSQLTSLIGTTRYAIQTRPAFFVTDQVPVQVDQVNGETLTISLGNKEGVFANGSTKIFLYDSILNIYHDLSLGGYTYIPATSTDSTRFKIVYQSQALGNPELDYNNNVIALIDNQVFSVQSVQPMKTIELFDIAGRKIMTLKANGQTMLTAPFQHAQGMYVARIMFDNGLTGSQKLINK